MGLTLDELKANPTLAKAILGYHVVLGVAAGPAELFAKVRHESLAPKNVARNCQVSSKLSMYCCNCPCHMIHQDLSPVLGCGIPPTS